MDARCSGSLFRMPTTRARNGSGSRCWNTAGLTPKNSLLHGPALLVANDGAFPDKDREALHKAIGGSKEDDADKIGTFGIGLKSVFHICEAFLYLGADRSEWRAGILNPWAGTGGSGDADPLHPDWDKIGEIDVERLRSVTAELLGETGNGLMLWIPIRRPEHLDRGAKDLPFGMGERCPKPDDLCAWFGCSAPAVLLLAQCGHLQAIETNRGAGPESLNNRVKLMRVARQTAGWVRRYQYDDREFADRTFEGKISSDESRWSVVGIEACGSKGLRQLRSQSDWPQVPQWRNGLYSTVPRKALAHAAVTVLRPSSLDAELVGTRLRWAVFLPLDDDPQPGSSAIVESVCPSPAWEIILHGYFWPSQDRRSIPGVTEESDNAPSDGDMRIRWNRKVCNELLLPLLPSALANAVVGVDERSAQRLLTSVVDSDMLKNRLALVRRRHWLLPIVAANGVRWKTLDTNSCSVLSIPKWAVAPEAVRRKFVAGCGECTDDVVFIDDDAPRLADEPEGWTVDHLKRLLNSITVDVFESPQTLRWIKEVVCHVLGPDACGGDIRAVAVARWLAGRIGDGALTRTTGRSASGGSRDDLRNAWRDLCGALPQSWIVATPMDSQRAVAELAAEGVIGEGLFPVPFGRRPDESPPPPQLDQERLDRALSTLGRRLETGGDSERSRHSRLVLAEALLAKRNDRLMGDLDGLPLLRAMRLPEEREEAWSVSDLRRRIRDCRVFASPVSEDSDEGTDGTRPERPSDPRRAVVDVAKALDEAAWLVSGEAAASVADAPPPTPQALAATVLQANRFAEPAHRIRLFNRLAPNISDDANVRLAARVLLAGHAADVVGENAELIHGRAENGRSMHILLRLLDQSWCAVSGELVESLSQTLLDALAVGQADLEALHRILDECLEKPVEWAGISDDEALHLLRNLYSAEHETQQRWRAMPLHRGVDGGRGAFNCQARRSAGKKANLGLPPELEAKVRFLDPDSEVAYLYESVPCVDRDGVLQLMLEDSRPWRFAEQIVQGVRSADGQITLPRGSGLRDLLRRRCWLPHRDGRGRAPDAVLVAPDEVLDAVADLAAANAFGDRTLPDTIDPRIWQMAEPVVRDILGHRSRDRQIRRMVDALNSDQVAHVDGGAWLVMPDPDLVNESLIWDALQTSLAGSHPGWKLVHTVKSVLRQGGSGFRDDSEPLVKLASALSAPVPLERRIEMLTGLADSRPAKDSPGGNVFRKLLECFAKAEDFRTHVLPKLDLPTQDGNWHPSREIARTETGVARRHRLLTELRPILLQLSGDDPVPPASSVGSNQLGAGLDVLDKYFEPWRGRLPHGAVGVFLSLLGNGSNDAIARLAEQWLGEDVSIEGVRRKLVGLDGQDPCASVSVFVSPQVARGDRVRAVNVLGSRVEMEAEADRDTIFAVDPIQRPPSSVWALAALGAYWEIKLRDIEPQSRSSSELVRLLGGTVERWATRYLDLDRELVTAWWSKWGKGSQADLDPVLASIKAHLPLTLQQLDVKDREPLRNALRKAERAQRKREQAPSEQTNKLERAALEHLETLIEEPPHQEFLRRRVCEMMQRYGYGDDSVLLELAQNADDALAQAAETTGGPLPPTACRLVVRIHEDEGTPAVDVTHWGRPINDTGGAAFPAGRERQWDQDLYYMMLMNLSGKPGEAPGVSSSSSTTGRFGLGFKSVHLVSSSPSVVSGFIAFSIAGGLLPRKRACPDETDSWMIEGRRATRIRLPLERDTEGQALIERLFRRFGYARVLLPAFARQVRQVVVEGGPSPGINVFDGKPIDGAPGWSVGAETELPNHSGRWQLLRFRPADAGRHDMGTAAVAVGLRDGVPTALGPDVPFLWNVTPTSESWGCGYVVNGPFKLDPGRTHVSLDDETTLRTVIGLGNALGRGLIELHDVLGGVAKVAQIPRIGGDGRGFLASLCKVLATGMDNPDTLRRSLLRELHANGRGLSAWMAVRSVVPTGLPAPFSPVLPPLDSGIPWAVAADSLASPDLCAALAEIDDKDFKSLADSRPIVTAEIEQLLRPLCSLAEREGACVSPTRLRPPDLLGELAERWDYRLTPARLHALRPLTQGTPWHLIHNDLQSVTWRGKFQARSADGSFHPLRRLLLRETSELQDDDGGDLAEEFLRSAFAPDARILDPTYIERSEDWRVFRWLRAQHRVDAAMIAEWCAEIPEGLHSAATHYLLRGELRSSVLQHLEPIEGRPSWLREYDDVCRLVDDQCEEPWRRQSLLGALFPDRFHEPEVPPRIRLDPETFFIHLLEWWDDAAVRSEVLDGYERRAWPEWLRRDGIAAGLRMDSEDHWLALLVLGACRSLGRAQDRQHRSFIELAHREGWWEVFKTPEDAGAWMKVLRDWQDGASAKLPYPSWMSLFPAIYQLSRYRDVYVRLLKSAGRRSEGMYQVIALLAPRIDEALTGTGTHFAAPPAPLGMGLHWVLRELVRLEIVGGKHLPDYVPNSSGSEVVLGELEHPVRHGRGAQGDEREAGEHLAQ